MEQGSPSGRCDGEYGTPVRSAGVNAVRGVRARGSIAWGGIASPCALCFVLAFTLMLLLPGLARAVPTVNGEFAVSGSPGKLTAGPDGNIWVLIDGAVNELARVTPAGAVTEYDIDDLNPGGGITSGPDGNLWFTDINTVIRSSPANPTAVTKTTINQIGGPQKIVTGPDGNLWTASDDNVIRIPPGNPAGYTAYNFPGLSARGIAAGGDGRIWVADFAGDRIIRIGTNGAGLVPYPTGAGSNPQDVTSGPGTQMAYSAPNTMQIGRITPGGLAIPTTSGQDPFGITRGGDGAYWVAQFASDDLGRLTPQGSFSTLTGFSAGSGPRQIAAGPGNTLWVALETAERVARVSGVEPPPPPPGPPTPGGDCATVSVARAVGLRTPRASRGGKRRQVRGVRLGLRLNVPAAIRVRRAVAVYRAGGTRRAAPLGTRRMRKATLTVRRGTALPLRIGRRPRAGRPVAVRLAILARPLTPGCRFARVRVPPVAARVGYLPRRGAL